ncbi:MAG: hypothetical protein WCE80_03465, partial [Acidimicrobiia bacterium]
ELSARRHVKQAAATARHRRKRRRGLAIRSGAVAAALALLVSTSGVAFAGGLPRPVQTFVADAAHMLPVPLPIPYPAPPPLVELPQEATPRPDLPSVDETKTVKGSDEPAPAVTGPPTEPKQPVDDVGRPARARWEGTDEMQEHKDVSVTRRGAQDDPSTDRTRGWDWRDGGGWDGSSTHRHRQDNDQDRSREHDRDR